MTASIAVVGLPFFGARSAQGLCQAGFAATYVSRPRFGLTSWPTLAWSIGRANLVYAIGSSIARNGPVDILSRLGKRVLMHWVGSDVLAAEADFAAGRASSLLARTAVHWCDAPWLVERLSGLGIQAELHPLPLPLAIGALEPFPSEFRVLVYLPARVSPAYDLEATLAVIRSLPDVPFTIVGGFQAPGELANAKSLGYVGEMTPIYRSSVALLRLVRHDGLSHSVVEALSFGRYALWSCQIPGATQVQSSAAAVAELRQLYERFSEGRLGLNLAGADAVTQRYNWTSIRTEVREGLDRILR